LWLRAKEGKAKRKKLHSVWVARIEEEENSFIGREGKEEQRQTACKIPRFLSGVWIPSRLTSRLLEN